mgnify:FL=1
MIWVWLAVLVAAIVIELLTPSALVSIWFAAGSLAAVVLEMLEVPFWCQLTVCLIVSVLLLLLVRPAATRYLRGNIIATNADRYIGAVGTVEEKITFDHWGVVRVEGSSWSAASYDHKEIEKGKKVRVIAIEGAKLLVSGIEE